MIKLTALHVAVISFDRDAAIEFQRLEFSQRSRFGEGISISRIRSVPNAAPFMGRT